MCRKGEWHVERGKCLLVGHKQIKLKNDFVESLDRKISIT